jgi:thiosulfate/3-mercaptopyruvate sulfurtransferase
MNWKINIIVLALIFSGCKQEKVVDFVIVEDNYLIEADELKTIAKQPNIKIIDFRKKDSYNTEHIVGALQMWRTDVEDTF